MTFVRILSFSLVAIGVPIFALGMDIKETDHGALCGGRPYARISVPDGASPYVELTADGVTGPFLLDYGATRSSLSATAFSGPDGSIRTAAISLPGIEKADFHLARYYLLLQPGNGQLGVIGDDLLSQFTVQLTDSTAFLSAETCRPEALIARGLTPVGQSGFFSSDPSKVGAGLPNVPVVFLRLGDVRVWAQIDTGYEDFVYSRSIDINQALFDRLVGSGAKLDRVNDIDIWTCDGREHRPVYRIKDRPLTIENEQGKPDRRNRGFPSDREVPQLMRGHRGHGGARSPARRLVPRSFRRGYFRSEKRDRLARRRGGDAASGGGQ